ncbi:Fe-S cluster assembly ATPase SufC [Candidatus Woesearchaeota archaeon]|nr:MAG: Fe-S cluster assembly ATPase SufC [Candidatus Woesearchaeota archaeon]
MRLEIRDLHVSVCKKKVLRGVNLCVEPGEFHAIMGPNGSGKSTLALTLAGHPDYVIEKGEILVDGESLLDMPPHKRALLGLFVCFQNPAEIDGVPLSKLLYSSAKLREPSLSILEFKKRLDKVCKTISVSPDFLERDVNLGFSGGEKKRAEVIQLLLSNPKFAVLDELDSGLDVDSLSVLSKAVNSLRGPEFSALIITHYDRILDILTPDKVHIMVDGKIVASGDANLAKEIESKGYASI